MSIQPSPNQTTPPITRAVNPIPVDKLCRLLAEYTERLNEKVYLFLMGASTLSSLAGYISLPSEFAVKVRKFTAAAQDKQREEHGWMLNWAAVPQLQDDVEFLYEQLQKLVDRGSAYHEHIIKDEGERFELELRLFDAEIALRYSGAILKEVTR